MPDIYLYVGHGSATILVVVDVNAQSQGDASLRVAAIKVGADVTAIESGGAIVDEIGAFLTFRRYGAGGA